MTKAKKDSPKARRKSKKPELKKQTVRDLDPEEQGQQVKGGEPVKRGCS